MTLTVVLCQARREARISAAPSLEDRRRRTTRSRSLINIKVRIRDSVRVEAKKLVKIESMPFFLKKIINLYPRICKAYVRSNVATTRYASNGLDRHLSLFVNNYVCGPAYVHIHT